MSMRASVRRTRPYTENGIKRVFCFRCRKQEARHQWQICSDGHAYRPICRQCDIQLNRVVLKFMGFSNVDSLVQKYSKSF